MSNFHKVPGCIVGDDEGEIFSLYPNTQAIMKDGNDYRAYEDLEDFKKDGGQA